VEFYKLLPPELLKQIAERLHATRAFDKEFDALNHRRPDDRSVRPLDYATPELARELKLPDPDKPSQLLWPPPQPNLALEMIAAIRPDPFLVHEAAKGTYIERVTAASLRTTDARSQRPSSASASSRSRRPPRLRPPRSVTDRLMPGVVGRRDSSRCPAEGQAQSEGQGRGRRSRRPRRRRMGRGLTHHGGFK
jgi:hypothetical protein